MPRSQFLLASVMFISQLVNLLAAQFSEASWHIYALMNCVLTSLANGL